MTLRYDSRSRVSTYTQSWVSNADPDFGAFESIATSVVGAGGTSTITFSSIPATYKHLQIRIHAMPSANHNITMRFNGDSASNYSYHNLSGNGSTVASNGGPENLMYLPGSSSGIGFPLTVVCDILDYADTNKYKTIRSLGSNDNNGAEGYIMFRSNNWRSAFAVTSFVLSGSFAQYSHFALYGIKA